MKKILVFVFLVLIGCYDAAVVQEVSCKGRSFYVKN